MTPGELLAQREELKRLETTTLQEMAALFKDFSLQEENILTKSAKRRNRRRRLKSRIREKMSR